MTRGYKNNNPGNIRYNKSNNWQGQRGSDPDFVIFKSLYYGVRALDILLKGYIKRGKNTVELILNNYAPSSENNTQAYIKAVKNDTGLKGVISPTNENLKKLILAISKHENGYLTDELKRTIENYYIGGEVVDSVQKKKNFFEILWSKLF